MRDKPKPGEWTFEDVAKLWTSGGFEPVAQAHNNALAAEREKYLHEARAWFDRDKQLRDQLAAERSKLLNAQPFLNETLKQLASEREKYQRSQEKVRKYFDLLAAEREKVKELEERLKCHIKIATTD